MELRKSHGYLHLVKPSDKPPHPFFRAGEPITETGIYRVFHNEHRVSHEVTLLAGQHFPGCDECGNDVHFELLRSAPEISRDVSFRINLYRVPHPQEPEEERSDEIVA